MEQHKIETVVIWGDSLAKGVVWNEARKRHAYSKTTAADIVAERLGIELVNRAKFGCTAPEGLAIMEREIEGGITCDTPSSQLHTSYAHTSNCHLPRPERPVSGQAPQRHHHPWRAAELPRALGRRAVAAG